MTASRIIRALAAFALVLVGLGSPAAAAASDSTATVQTARVASVAVPTDVDDFSYASWEAEYEVGLDEDGRSEMHVTETLVARFPDADQNRGIVRGLPTSYEGAGLDTRVLSVTDGSGSEVPYETDEEDGLLLVLTGDDDYVRGLSTYVIEYEMRDVILSTDLSTGSGSPESESPSGKGVDEFYWDLLPLDSTQPIERFRADVVFDDAMASRLTGAASCYSGQSGSTASCDLRGPVQDGDAAVFRVESAQREAGDGVTVAIGFEAGTAAQPPARMPNPVTDVVPLAAAAAAAGLSIGSWVAVSAFRRRRRVATGIIVAQYDVPVSLPPLLAAPLLPGAKSVVPAEIVHLAVRRDIRIEEGDAPEHPRLRRLTTDASTETLDTDPLDAEALDALFVDADDDSVTDLPTASEDFAMRMVALEQSGKTAAASRGFTTTARSRGAAILQWTAVAVGTVGFALALWGVISGRLSAIPALVVMSFILFIVLISCFYAFARHTVLTAEGARAFEYLKGVEEFVRVAEADRLQMLQSYSGAERRQDGAVDVIHLYERLLPYAMLFGMEDEWGEVLEGAYARAQRGPDWIGDPTSPYLRLYLTSFAASSHAAATYTSPTADSSSSSGGSFGGGFSGGGGGGGFSGGR